jgi:polyisoprenoid-binding protein YceI
MSWKIDTAHTQVMFSVRHMMITKVRGAFEKFSGSVELDEAYPENTLVNVQVETASVNTRDGQRDGHLRSPDFFGSLPPDDLHRQARRPHRRGQRQTDRRPDHP